MPSLARSEPVTADGGPDPRARLRDIIAARSFRLGQMFRLVSGVETSDRDCRNAPSSALRACADADERASHQWPPITRGR